MGQTYKLEEAHGFLMSSYLAPAPSAQSSHRFPCLPLSLPTLLCNRYSLSYMQANEREEMVPNKATADELGLLQQLPRSQLWVSRLIVSMYVKLFS
jgi:hypothetical protein